MGAARRGIVAMVGFAVSLALVAPAAAKTFEVTKRGDPIPDRCKKRDCSLREAVIAANNRSGPDRIVLPKRKTYNLSIPNSIPPGEDEAAEGDLDVTSPLRVVHQGKGRAKIDANGIDRVFELFAPTTTMRKLVIRGGSAGLALGGGGIEMVSSADLTLARTVVKRNESAGDGGGISGNDGVIVIRRSKISGNSSGDDAGGVQFFSEAEEPSRITKSTIASNTAEGSGGGVQIAARAVSIRSSTIANNSAGAEGGGIADDSRLEITNSTVAGNHSEGVGGGIAADDSDSDVRANAITVARNSSDDSGGGLFYFPGAVGFEIENSLIALNKADFGGADCTGGADDFDSLGHNLLSTDEDCEGFDAAGDIVRPNPRLGKLKNNGGPTQTVALKKRSPAINKADKQSAPNRDQRGKKRGKKPDIGAYERVKKQRGRR